MTGMCAAPAGFQALVGEAGTAVLSLEDKLDEALKDTFPASDAFYLAPDDERSRGAGTPPPAAASNVARRKE